MEERVLATANQRADRLKHLIRTGSPQTFGVLNRKWIVGTDGEVYHYQYYDPRNRELNSLSVFDFDPQTHALKSRTFVAARDLRPGSRPRRRDPAVAARAGLDARVRPEDAGQHLHALRRTSARASSRPTTSSPRRASPS